MLALFPHFFLNQNIDFNKYDLLNCTKSRSKIDLNVEMPYNYNEISSKGKKAIRVLP